MASAVCRKPKITRSEWALILLLAGINFTHILDFVIVMPLGNQLMSELEISPEQFAHILNNHAQRRVTHGLGEGGTRTD